MSQLTSIVFCALLTAGGDETQRDASSEISPQSSCTAAAERADRREHAQAQEAVEVWLDLSLPALSSQPDGSREARAARLARIEQQQNEVIAQLVALGAEEIARITEVRNAVAVRMPASAIQKARDLPGVVKVRPVQHRKRMPQCSSRN